MKSWSQQVNTRHIGLTTPIGCTTCIELARSFPITTKQEQKEQVSHGAVNNRLDVWLDKFGILEIPKISPDGHYYDNQSTDFLPQNLPSLFLCSLTKEDPHNCHMIHRRVVEQQNLMIGASWQRGKWEEPSKCQHTGSRITFGPAPSMDLTHSFPYNT